MNLGINASHAMIDGGELIFSTENIYLDKIFEPFFTTKENGKGSGIGLSSVYGIIQNHHGALTVYSEKGDGTVFHIYLPNLEVDAEPSFFK